jgi:ribosomal protein L37AE/L43A
MVWVKGKTWDEVLGVDEANKRREQSRVITIERNKSEKQRNILSKRVGEKSPNWKGDEVGYLGVHWWIRKYKPKPELCEHCHNKKPKDCANISGKYKRDVTDYIWLCRKCHMIFDGTYETIKKQAIENAKKMKGKSWEDICGIDRTKERKSTLIRDEQTGKFLCGKDH